MHEGALELAFLLLEIFDQLQVHCVELLLYLVAEAGYPFVNDLLNEAFLFKGERLALQTCLRKLLVRLARLRAGGSVLSTLLL